MHFSSVRVELGLQFEFELELGLTREQQARGYVISLNAQVKVRPLWRQRWLVASRAPLGAAGQSHVRPAAPRADLIERREQSVRGTTR